MDGRAMDCQPSNNQWVRIFWQSIADPAIIFFFNYCNCCPNGGGISHRLAVFRALPNDGWIQPYVAKPWPHMAGSSHMWPNSGWPHKAGSSHMWPKRGHIWLDPAICGQKAKYGWIEPYVDENQQHMAGCSHMWVKNPHIIMAGSSLKKLFG
jgi:hypothetical protein